MDKEQVFKLFESYYVEKRGSIIRNCLDDSFYYSVNLKSKKYYQIQETTVKTEIFFILESFLSTLNKDLLTKIFTIFEIEESDYKKSITSKIIYRKYIQYLLVDVPFRFKRDKANYLNKENKIFTKENKENYINKFTGYKFQVNDNYEIDEEQSKKVSYIKGLFEKNGVCESEYMYLFRLFAFNLFNIDKSLRVPIMPILQGIQGAGKDTAFSLLKEMCYSNHYVLTDEERLFSRFNSDIDDAVIVHLSEFEGQRKFQGKLKAIITDETITIEDKGKRPRNIENDKFFIATTNNDVKLKVDDRRYVVIEFNMEGFKSKKEAQEYCSKIHENRKEYAEAFFKYLYFIYLSELKSHRENVNKLSLGIKTKIMENMVDVSRSTIEAFVYDILDIDNKTIIINNKDIYKEEFDECRISFSEMYDFYLRFTNEEFGENSYKISSRKFSRKFLESFKSLCKNLGIDILVDQKVARVKNDTESSNYKSISGENTSKISKSFVFKFKNKDKENNEDLTKNLIIKDKNGNTKSLEDLLSIYRMIYYTSEFLGKKDGAFFYEDLDTIINSFSVFNIENKLLKYLDISEERSRKFLDYIEKYSEEHGEKWQEELSKFVGMLTRNIKNFDSSYIIDQIKFFKVKKKNE